MAKGSSSAAGGGAGGGDASFTPSPPPVFIDTNLNTHLAMIVSPDDTVADLKRKVCVEHVTCFPNIGDIIVHSMKVRRRATYYHLSDSMLVRTAFDRIKGTWFLHIDVSPIHGDGNVAGSDTNKGEWGGVNGPPSIDSPIKADSDMKSNDPSFPDVSLPFVSDKKQSLRLRLSSNVLSEEILTDHLNKNVNDKDFTNAIDEVNEGVASTVPAEKEKSRKRSTELEDDHLLKPSFEKNRHKKEEEKENPGTYKGHDKDPVELTRTENVAQDNISTDYFAGDLSFLDANCGQVLKDDSILPGELLHVNKKRKKKRRKELDGGPSEIDGSLCLDASDNLKNSTLGTGLSEITSNKNDLISEVHGEISKNKSAGIKSPSKSENSALDLGNVSDVIDLESHNPLTDQLNKNVNSKDFANDMDEVNAGDASTVATEKETSRKSSTKLKDGRLLRPSCGKRRHKKEEENENPGSYKDDDKDPVELTGTANVVQENISKDRIAGDTFFGDDCNQLLKDDSMLPEELLHEKKKRKKKRRKESDECHNEIDASMCLGSKDSLKNSTPGSGLSDHTSSKNDLVLRKEITEDDQEKTFPVSDNNQDFNSAMKLPSGENAEDSTNEKNMEMPSEVPAKEKKRSACHDKKVQKGEPSNSESGKAEITPPFGKEINGENPGEVPANDLKYLAVKPIREIVPEEDFGLGNAVEILSHALPQDVRSSSHNKKRSHKAGSSKVKSRKDGSSATNIEETAVVAGNFIQADSTLPHTKKDSTRSKKKSVKAKESFAEAPCGEDPPIVDPASLVDLSLTEKHADLPKGPSTKQQSEIEKHKTAKKLKDVQNDEGGERSDLLDVDISPSLQASKGPQSENHDQDIFTNDDLQKPPHHNEANGSGNYMGKSSRSDQQKICGNSDNSTKVMNAKPVASGDSTEQETSYNEKLYRVAVRKKVPKGRLKADSNKSKPQIFQNAADDIFGRFASTSSEVEDGHNRMDARNVSNNSTCDKLEKELEQAQLVRGPNVQISTNSQGPSASSAHLLERKGSSDDYSDDGITLSQTSIASKKSISLGVLLRNSHSYRKAKLTAQSQTDDTESQPIDVVPETQQDSP